ncbi:MAG: SDR family oxidoreductase [Flavobacteriales bacterium]|nr:SDR family oxidoreductase [Flavobacteriales bacterium]
MYKDSDMKDRWIVVTGASRGVGREVVRCLVADHGCPVLAVSRASAPLEELKAELKDAPGILEPLVCDISTDAGVGRVVEQVAMRRLAGLLNNAGVLVKRDMGAWASEDAALAFHVNATVPLLLSQALADRLAGDPPGHVVNIGSMGGFQGSAKFPGLAAYSASKAALACLTECLAEEWKDKQVRVNCLAIGAVDTDMLRQAFPGYRAPVDAAAMGAYVARFLLEGHGLYNGKVLPVSVSTP